MLRDVKEDRPGMEYTWICIVVLLSVLLTTLSAAPVNNNTNVKNETQLQEIRKVLKECAGETDKKKCEETKRLCKTIRNELGQTLQHSNQTVNTTTSKTEEICLDDILLTNDQARNISKVIKQAQRRRKKRKIRSDFNINKWNNTIYFMMDTDVDVVAATEIRKGVELWNSSTCINFVEIYDFNFINPHLIFVLHRTACASYVGRAVGLNRQPIYLSHFCMSKAVIAHEIMHSLGAIHEHQRTDRDAYITIKTSNILNGYYGYFAQFIPSLVTDLQIQYDYSSVMHYYGSAFTSRSGLNTIETKDPRYQHTIGQRVELSFLDVRLINLAYCNKTCSNDPRAKDLSCNNHGYPDPSNCSICRCPDGWSGRTCTKPAPAKHASCGGVLNATSEKQYITSPGYEHGNYEDGQECTWIIQTRGTKNRVKLEFTNLDIFQEHSTCYHWVEVRSKFVSPTLLDLKGPRYCGKQTPGVITSDSNFTMVLFRARFESRHRQRAVGFRLQYSTDGSCSSRPCLNNGACQDTDSGYECKCIGSYYGKQCQNYRFKYDFNLVMMLDSTYHTNKDFYYIKEMAKRIFTFTSSTDHTVHKGLMTFHKNPVMHSFLHENSSLNNLLNIITSLQTEYGQTDIMGAFNALFQNYYSHTNNVVPNIAIMTTDSDHYVWTSQGMIRDVATKLRDRCIEVIVIIIRNEEEFLAQLISHDQIMRTDNEQILISGEFIHKLLSAIDAAVLRSNNCIKQRTTTTTTSTTTTTTTSTTTTTKPTTTTTSSTAVPTTTTTTTKRPTVRSTKPRVTNSKSTTVPTTTTTTTTTITTSPTTTTTTSTTTSPTTTTSNTTPTTTTTTVASTQEKCVLERKPCESEKVCGGCSFREVVHTCTKANGQKKVVDTYKEPCDLKPCEKDCSVYIGRYYPRTCYLCCSGFQQRGTTCVQLELRGHGRK